jgi:hypothetical protein
MTVAELLNRVSSHEISEWMAEDRIRAEERAAAEAEERRQRGS